MMRKKISIAGGIAGMLYTAAGLAAAYHNPPVPTGFGTIVLQFFVFSLFTVPFGAAIGLGIGLLVDGVRKSK